MLLNKSRYDLFPCLHAEQICAIVLLASHVEIEQSPSYHQSSQIGSLLGQLKASLKPREFARVPYRKVSKI